MEYIQQQFVQIFGTEWGAMLFSLATNMTFIFAIVIPLLLGVAYLTRAQDNCLHANRVDRIGNL